LLTRSKKKVAEFDDVIKSGRTHLQDAMPIRLGQEFTAYGGTLRRGTQRVAETANYLRELGIGGSAVGTGVNVEPEYPELMIHFLEEMTHADLREGSDRIQLMQSMGDVAAFSSQMRVLALDMSKLRATSDFWRAGRALASMKSACPRCSRAPPSCREK
jgi:aspartate ammonia-lyase